MTGLGLYDYYLGVLSQYSDRRIVRTLIYENQNKGWTSRRAVFLAALKRTAASRRIHTLSEKYLIHLGYEDDYRNELNLE